MDPANPFENKLTTVLDPILLAHMSYITQNPDKVKNTETMYNTLYVQSGGFGSTAQNTIPPIANIAQPDRKRVHM